MAVFLGVSPAAEYLFPLRENKNVWGHTFQPHSELEVGVGALKDRNNLNVVLN